MATSTRTVIGSEQPHLFAATPIHPMYMYKKDKKINKENNDSLS
jgi:hypothetical protein